MTNVPITKFAGNAPFDANVSTGVAKLIGFRLRAFGGGEAVVELESGPQHYNPMGTVHGGVLCDIADGHGSGVRQHPRCRPEFYHPGTENQLPTPGVGVHVAGQSACDFARQDGGTDRVRRDGRKRAPHGACLQHVPGTQRTNGGRALMSGSRRFRLFYCLLACAINVPYALRPYGLNRAFSIPAPKCFRAGVVDSK
jgi:hypothetical protein